MRCAANDTGHWWGIWDAGSGSRVSGPPEPFYHPMLETTVTIARRRWKLKRDATSALEAMRDMALVLVDE